MSTSRNTRLVTVIAGVAVATGMVAAPALAGDAKTKFQVSGLRHTCKNVDRVPFHVKLTHAVPHARYRFQGTMNNSSAVLVSEFTINKSTTFKHHEVMTAENGDAPTTKTKVYLTLYHVKKHTNTQINFTTRKATLPACTK
jgi:hypothetical protein